MLLKFDLKLCNILLRVILILIIIIDIAHFISAAGSLFQSHFLSVHVSPPFKKQWDHQNLTKF